jgi:hypothetical protein
MELDKTDILSIYNETIYVNNIVNELPVLQGNFIKSILLFKNPKDETEECETLLIKMLTACGVTKDDCYSAVITHESQTIALINAHHPKIILSFGIYIANELYKLYPHINVVQKIMGSDAMITMPLHKLLNDVPGKNALWAGLQTMFSLPKK